MDNKEYNEVSYEESWTKKKKPSGVKEAESVKKDKKSGWIFELIGGLLEMIGELF